MFGCVSLIVLVELFAVVVAQTCFRDQFTLACLNETHWYTCTSEPKAQTKQCPSGTVCKCYPESQCPESDLNSNNNPCGPQDHLLVKYPDSYFVEISGGSVSVAFPVGQELFNITHGTVFKRGKSLRYKVDMVVVRQQASTAGVGQGLSLHVVVPDITHPDTYYMVDSQTGQCYENGATPGYWPDPQSIGVSMRPTAKFVSNVTLGSGESAVQGRVFMWQSGCSNPGVACITENFTAAIQAPESECQRLSNEGCLISCSVRNGFESALPAYFKYLRNQGAIVRVSWAREIEFNRDSIIEVLPSSNLFVKPKECTH
ncbi:hypothetical protein Pelo_89 [Pelomyxa schiedti]|nr:hypothetical protein Pelo_89 [Pelomyxa schiedti]